MIWLPFYRRQDAADHMILYATMRSAAGTLIDRSVYYSTTNGITEYSVPLVESHNLGIAIGHWEGGGQGGKCLGHCS